MAVEQLEEERENSTNKHLCTKHCSKHFIEVDSVNPQANYEASVIIINIPETETKQFAQDHTAWKYQSKE